MTKREVQVGQELPTLEIRAARPVVVCYAGTSTDFDEIHFSDHHAHATGLPGALAHGMWTMGAGLGLITRWIDDSVCIGRYCVRPTRPVVVPDTDEGTLARFIGAAATVADRVVTASLTVTCGGDAILGAAKAEVRID